MLTRSHWDVLCSHFDSPHVRCALAKADDVGDPTAVGSLLAEVVESASRGAALKTRAASYTAVWGASRTHLQRPHVRMAPKSAPAVPSKKFWLTVGAPSACDWRTA